MSDDSDWTTGTLFVHFNQRFIDSEKAVRIAQEAAQRATDHAQDAQANVNRGQNEFRGQLKDQAAGLMPRPEADQRYATTVQMIGDARAEHRKGIDELRRLVYIATGIAMAVAAGLPLLLRK